VYIRASTGEIDERDQKEFDDMICLMMAHQLGEDVTGKVVHYASPEKEEGFVWVQIELDGLKYESYFGTNSLLPDSAILPDVPAKLYSELQQRVDLAEFESKVFRAENIMLRTQLEEQQRLTNQFSEMLVKLSSDYSEQNKELAEAEAFLDQAENEIDSAWLKEQLQNKEITDLKIDLKDYLQEIELLRETIEAKEKLNWLGW
jgi:hypothetical protein